MTNLDWPPGDSILHQFKYGNKNWMQKFLDGPILQSNMGTKIANKNF